MMKKILPSMFISHGAPTFALEPGRAGALLQAAGRALRDVSAVPIAVLIISPHWTTSGLTVMTTPMPATLHDFGNWGARMQRLQYPAPGHPAKALATAEVLIALGYQVKLDAQRGFDHGAWVPLLHLLPSATVPTFQLSMPHDLTPAQAFALGRALQPMSEQGVLIIGSGSITHNLSELSFDANKNPNSHAPYAEAFVTWVRERVQQGDAQALIHARTEAPQGARAHPTDEHFLPFLIALGAARTGANAELLDGGFTHSVIGMDSYIWHAPQ